MKNLIKISAILLLGTMGFQNMNAQKIQKVNGKNISNPYYSRTDTKILKISNSDWKKVLNKDLYSVSRLNELKWLTRESTINSMVWERTIVQLVETHFSNLMQNSPVLVAGRAFLKPFVLNR